MCKKRLVWKGQWIRHKRQKYTTTNQLHSSESLEEITVPPVFANCPHFMDIKG